MFYCTSCLSKRMFMFTHCECIVNILSLQSILLTPVNNSFEFAIHFFAMLKSIKNIFFQIDV